MQSDERKAFFDCTNTCAVLCITRGWTMLPMWSIVAIRRVCYGISEEKMKVCFRIEICDRDKSYSSFSLSPQLLYFEATVFPTNLPYILMHWTGHESNTALMYMFGIAIPYFSSIVAKWVSQIYSDILSGISCNMGEIDPKHWCKNLFFRGHILWNLFKTINGITNYWKP